MSTPWYYAVNGERKGPVEEEELRALLSAGTVTGDALVWTAGMAQWLPARACPALAGQLTLPVAAHNEHADPLVFRSRTHRPQCEADQQHHETPTESTAHGTVSLLPATAPESAAAHP